MPGSLVLGLLMLRRGLQRKVLKTAATKAALNGISSVESVKLGGAEQQILIQGKDRTKPVFLVVHGGPGLPFPAVAYRSRSHLALKDSELSKHFVLVYWEDQQGCGKSSEQEAPKGSMTVERLILDTIDLTRFA